ncbi:hypothetical protein NFHSH190041_14620 [Shewanella sp. NFH-SH190041]|uniref:electron transport complex subunit RsxC n=1 Tax=Shewanella sp. NFH-SH190041 TaxID=2950245 RepID=UPI0021C42E19|nr:electron transport complex subunit RsxC [Shewanella sp. NFH-SH190041]BDM64010.1 hypothetical protein NFHSH190041_14620 [Shewanella sp. NFH-SH190041]
MLTLLEQLDNGVLWRIPGGIHPPEQKCLSNTSAIAQLPLDNEYWVPVPQIGEQAAAAVQIGDHVLKGQPLTRGVSPQHLPVHAPTSGTVTAIAPMASNHASGLPVLTCVIKADGQDTWLPLQAANPTELSDSEIVARVHAAGVAGMGGAAFPTHIKLSPTSEIDLVIINGVECEPYITSDDRLMREHSNRIISGIEIIHRLLSPQRIVIAVEDNKPEAAAALGDALRNSALPDGIARVTVIPTKYPSGGEKQLIQIITGKEVPSGAIPAQLGILVHNVGTCAAISDAVYLGKPLIERVVTVTGENVQRPGNYLLPIGSRIDHVLQQCGFTPDPEQKVIIGGPMMGHTLPQLQVPVLKGTNCILVPSRHEMALAPKEQACIRCSECAQACPANLLPQQLYWHAKSGDYEKAAGYNLRDCIECGCCSYVCPSDIPLVEYFRVAKSALRHDAEEKLKSERAKQRFEAKQQRIEAEKQAREAKAKQAAARRQASMGSAEKDAIAEAMARIQAKKAAAAAGTTPQSSTVNAPEASANSAANAQDKVAAAIARAKAKKAAQAGAATPVSSADNAATSQQDKVAAAIARAKAKKAAQSASTPTSNVTAPQGDVSQQDKIAAAVARAKAKKAAAKAALNAAADNATDNVSADSEAGNNVASQTAAAQATTLSAEEQKKARIAAAVAKAKAKKATAANAETAESITDIPAAAPTDIASTNLAETETSAPNAATAAADNSQATEMSAEAAKKARIAAAVAKAKAKKAAAASAEATQSITDIPAAVQADIASTDLAETETSAPSTATADSSQAIEISPEAAKKARIAAAVAKAKAKKAAAASAETTQSIADIPASGLAETETSAPNTATAATDNSQATEITPEAAKKARIAAAVAKAKAKKAAQLQQDKE